MRKFGYLLLLLLCLNICACTGLEEVTVIHSRLIIRQEFSPPPQVKDEVEEDFPEDGDNISEDIQNHQLYSGYSKKFGIELDGKENKLLLAAIDEWLGTRYKSGGCSKSGVDCSCFVRAVCKKAYNISLGRSSSEMFNDNLVSVRLDQVKEGDLLFFRNRNGQIFHVGIYLKKDKFVHVSRLKGVKVSSIGVFGSMLFSARRIKQNNEIASKTSDSRQQIKD